MRAPFGASARQLLFIGAASLLFACQKDPPSPLPAAPDSVVVLPSAKASPAPVVASAAPAVESASATPVASAPVPAASASAASAPEAPPHVVDMANKAEPTLASEDFTVRGKLLFEAIQSDDAEHAPTFFFPRDPFLPLKDIKNPGKYWDQLFRTYKNDIHELHRKHAKTIEGATFESITLGSTPTWVKPGEEANKIGYYRTFNAKLRYTATDGKTHVIEVKTIISWDLGWYCTHLLPIKH